MPTKNDGVMIILSSPSGAGKTTLVRLLSQNHKFEVHEISIREVRLSSGAEFIVVICGSVMTMPGLPKIPAADSITLNKKGEIEGLF